MYSALFSIYSSVRLGFLHILQPKPEAATVKAVGLRTQLCPVKTGITEMCTGGTFKSEGAAGKRASIQATESGQVVRREPVGPAGWTAEGKGRSRSRGAWGKQRGSLLRGPESGDIHGRRPRNRPAGNRHPNQDRHPGGRQASRRGTGTQQGSRWVGGWGGGERRLGEGQRRGSQQSSGFRHCVLPKLGDVQQHGVKRQRAEVEHQPARDTQRTGGPGRTKCQAGDEMRLTWTRPCAPPGRRVPKARGSRGELYGASLPKARGPDPLRGPHVSRPCPASPSAPANMVPPAAGRVT